jgi:hypothetical protein
MKTAVELSSSSYVKKKKRATRLLAEGAERTLERLKVQDQVQAQAQVDMPVLRSESGARGEGRSN